jgi:bifunctional ADP-heptose synthase (sugar kinase/adenylyltransferase)
LASCGKAPREAAVAVRNLQFVEQPGRTHVQHREAAACGLMRQGTRQPRLAAAGGAGDEQIARMAQPVAAGQRGDEAAVQRAAGAPVDVLDAGRADLELGGLEKPRATRRSSRQAISRCTGNPPNFHSLQK